MEKLLFGPSTTRSTFIPCCSQPFRTIRTFKLPCLVIFGHMAFLGAPGPNLGAPRSSKLVQKLQLGPPIACSNFVIRYSNRLGLPKSSNRHLGHIWAIFGPFKAIFWSWRSQIPKRMCGVCGTRLRSPTVFKDFTHVEQHFEIALDPLPPPSPLNFPLTLEF